ncbi:MBOAT family O-acyltransferase, partial [Bacteroides congonensis]|uniref:MBOAT family O-acyltransferase n=1 Tax=Bacteroides congonensis TaxID=1871006 RepID=UPI0032196542
MSLWFYGYFNPSYLLIICGSIAVNYLISQIMIRAEQEYLRKFSLILGICGNVAVIFYFKYFNFFLENVNSVFGKSFELRNIVLPLGISFFTFQQISYLVDSYRGETKGYSFDEYALFVSFFPQLIAGPIVLHNEMIPQFRQPEKRRFIPENFSKGMYIFSLGLFKKVI